MAPILLRPQCDKMKNKHPLSMLQWLAQYLLFPVLQLFLEVLFDLRELGQQRGLADALGVQATDEFLDLSRTVVHKPQVLANMGDAAKQAISVLKILSRGREPLAGLVREACQPVHS